MSSDMSMGLDVTIRGNADSLVTAANQGESSIKGLEGVSSEALGVLSAAISKLDLDFVKWSETSKNTETQVKKTAETAKSEGAQIEGFADRVLQHNYAVARGLEAVGLSSEASAARVGGALEAIKAAMSGLNPVLLGLTAGAGGAFAVFELFKSSAEAASKWQQDMEVLGQTVRNQGGDWAKLRDTVAQWADLQEKTTAFSSDEAVGALKELTAAGTGVSDAMKIVRVAEDAAAATGHSLTDVVHGLMEAEHGRTQVLAELGIGTSAMIKKGTDLQTILNLIEQSMGGAAAQAADTYAGKVSQLSNAVESLKEDIGSKLLPTMTKFVDGVKDWVDAADANLPDVAKRFDDVKSSVKGLVDFITSHEGDIELFFDVVIGVKAIQALNALKLSFVTTMAAGGTFTTVIETMASVFTVGLIPTIQAVIASLGALFTAENLALLGIPALIGGVIYAWQHWKETVDVVSGTLSGIANVLDGLESPLHNLTNALRDQIPVIGKIDDLWHRATQSIRDYANAKSAAVNATPQSDYSKRMAIDEEIIAKDGKVDVDPAHAGWTVKQAQADLDSVLAAMHGSPANPVNTSLGSNPTVGHVGGAAKHGAGAGSATAIQAQDEKQLATAHDDLAKASGTLAAANKALTATVNPLTDAESELVAKHKALNNAAYAASQQIKQLESHLGDEEAAVRKARTEVENAYTAYKHLYDTLGPNAEATKKAKEAYDAADKSLKSVNATLQHHLALTTGDTKAINANTAAQNANWKAYNDSREQNTQKDADERNTYGKSLAEQISYFQQRLANLKTSDADYLAEKAALENKIDDLQTEEYKQAINAAKKAHEDQIKEIQKFADEGVTLFNSFFEKGKHGMSAFSDAFKKMLDDMLVALERSALTGLLERMLGVSTAAPGTVALPGGGSVPGMSLAAPGGGGSWLANALGIGSLVGGGAPAAGSLAAFNAASDQAAQQAFASYGGGAAPGASSGGASGFAGLLGGKIPWGKDIGGASVGSYLAAAAGGAMVGQTVFGGKGFADVGGALGATAALALAGPAGWAAIAAMTLGGALIGGGAGSLFGNHFNPANEPDITQTDLWGQSNADMNGNTSASPMNANGKQFVMDSWTQQATNGKGWNLTFEKFVQLFRGKESSLPKSLQSAFPRIQQLWGGATDQPNFNHDGKDGWLDIGSGARAKWTEFWQYVQQFGPQIAQMVDQYQSNDVYTSSNGSASLSGTYTPSGSPSMLHGLPDYGAYVPSTSVSSPSPGGSPSPSPGPGGSPDPGNPSPIHQRGPQPMVVINQTVRGSVVTENQLYAAASTAAGRASRVSTIRSINRVGK